MEIKFEKLNSVYVAEFKITSNCNIHIEREDLGMFTIESRGSKSGKYVPMENGYYGDKYTIDVDMLGNIYPKCIKITSASKPTYAEVNFAGEGGNSGGGGNSDDGGGLTYFDLSGISNDDIIDTVMYASIVKAISATDAPDEGVNAGDIIILPMIYFMDLETSVSLTPIAIGIALQERTNFMGQSITIEDFVKNEIGDEVYNSIPRITKEEFYNI
jgi:hypothetical protein